MRQAFHERLDALFDEYEPLACLHDVPPHEVWLVRADGRRVVLKGDTGPTGHAAREGHVTDFVGRETSVPVPEVRHVGPGCYVAAWHPDVPAPDADSAATDEWCRAAGRTLAMLHEESASLTDGFGVPAPDGVGLTAPHGDWHAAASAYLEARRSTLAQYGHADVAAAVRDHLAERPDAFDGAGESVCCHGWWTPEHVAVGGGAVRCVVDFEHALAAPAAFDYWRTALPTFLAADDREGPTAFREAYESVRPLPGVDRCRTWILLLCETYYLESLFVQARHDPPATAERAAWLRGQIDERLASL